MNRDSYHHGDLKAVILTHAATLVAERGADGVSLRELARAAGVSHAAPAHHFTDRRGLFTALAAQGWRQLAGALAGARPEFLDAAVAYVQFAVDHPGHYAVMFDRSLVHSDDPDLIAAQVTAGAELAAGVATLSDPLAAEDPEAAGLAAWSLVHGFAMLWLNGVIDSTARPQARPGAGSDSDAVATAQRVARMLFRK